MAKPDSRPPRHGRIQHVDLGLNTPEDCRQLQLILATIAEVDSGCSKLPTNLDELARPNTEIGELLAQLPEPQVDLRLTVVRGLTLARGSLDLVRHIFGSSGPPIVPPILPVVLRSALLGAGRVAYMLGPEDENERIANSQIVLRQEAESYRMAYKSFSEFQQLAGLVPSQQVVETYETRRAALMVNGRPPREAKTLDSMAEVIGELLNSAGINDGLQGAVSDPAAQIKEHVRWIFHVYSGIAHGLAWPWLVPSTEDLPGHFIADFTMIASIVNFAVSVTIRRAGIV